MTNLLKNMINKSILTNRSKTYLLPLISDYIEIKNKTINNVILNTYIEFDNNEHKNCIFLLCDYLNNNEEYEEFEKSIFMSDLFIKHFEFGNKVGYLIKFPEYYMREYFLYKKGLYSEYGDDCKLKIIRYWNKILGRSTVNVPIVKKIKQILYKDPELNAKMRNELKIEIALDQELGEAYNERREKFNFKEEE